MMSTHVDSVAFLMQSIVIDLIGVMQESLLIRLLRMLHLRFIVLLNFLLLLPDSALFNLHPLVEFGADFVDNSFFHCIMLPLNGLWPTARTSCRLPRLETLVWSRLYWRHLHHARKTSKWKLSRHGFEISRSHLRCRPSAAACPAASSCLSSNCSSSNCC